MEKESRSGGGDEEEDGQDEVRQYKRKLVEKFDIAKNIGKLLGWLGEEASKNRTDDRTKAPD